MGQESLSTKPVSQHNSEEAARRAFIEAPLSETPLPHVEASRNAFLGDLEQLLEKHEGQWVGYHNGVQVAVDPSRKNVEDACIALGYDLESCLILGVIPQIDSEFT